MQSAYDQKTGLALYKRQCARTYREPLVRTPPPLTLKETMDWARQVPRSARVAQGFVRIGDFARSVQRLRVKRTELRKQHPDRLRRTILDILERVVSDRDDIRRAARRAARIKWRSKFDAVWGGGNPRVYDSVRLIGGRYYPRCAIAVPAAWLLARLTRAEIVTAIRKKREQLKEDAEQQTRRQAKIRACAPAPDAPDTLGWRGWRFDGQVLISPMQGTRWCDATMRAELWSDGDAVRGFSGIHARRLPPDWRRADPSVTDIGLCDVHGIVERFGRYVLGTEGWRAEWVVIRELMAPNTETALALMWKYPDVRVHVKEQEAFNEDR